MTLTLTIPEYSNKRVSRPVQVYFYVSNGRRKRSPTQSFKFLPGASLGRLWSGQRVWTLDVRDSGVDEALAGRRLEGVHG